MSLVVSGGLLLHHGMAVQGVHCDLPSQYGDWIRKNLLGSGAFGSVHLWKNGRTGQEIAIKKCLNIPKPQAMKRWETEVNMMESMKHPNIVSFLPIPEVLTGEYMRKYSLGMEYCPEGDLRKFMVRAVYCCGLTECHVRDLLADIGSAIDYLHHKHNLHRDLKPENIVIKRRPDAEGRYTFKVTDLGYAKDLDLYSCGKSFVGTLYYLAPEIFNVESLRYFSQVDFWSLGVLSFESITGYRPFFKHSAAPQVLDLIKKKKKESICAWFEAGKPRYGNSLPAPHHLNPHFAADMTVWLRLMLHNDPDKRGGSEGQWYTKLKEILSKKYINVFYITTMKMITLPIQDQSYLQKVRLQIQRETRIEKTDQLLLLKDGKKPDENAKVVDGLWREHSAEEWVTYLFYDTGQNSPAYQSSIPAQLQNFYSGHQTEKNEDHTKRLVKIALYTVLENVKLAKYFLNAILCLNQSVARQGKHFVTRSRDFTHLVGKCSGMVYIMKKSIETDLAECGPPESVDGMAAFSSFRDLCHEMVDHIQQWEKEIDDANAFFRQCDKEFASFDKLTTLSSDLNKQLKYFSSFEENAISRYDQARREIQVLRESDKCDGERKSNECRRTNLMNFIKEFVIGSIEKLGHLTGRGGFYNKMRSLLSQQKKISETIFKLDGNFLRMQQVQGDVSEIQTKHHLAMWKLLSHIKEVHSKAGNYNEEEVANMFSSTEQHKSIMNNSIHGILDDPSITQVLEFAFNSFTSTSFPTSLATPNTNCVSPATNSCGSILRPELSSSVSEEQDYLSSNQSNGSSAYNRQTYVPNQHTVASREANTNGNNNRSGGSDLEISGASSDSSSYK